MNFLISVILNVVLFSIVQFMYSLICSLFKKSLNNRSKISHKRQYINERKY